MPSSNHPKNVPRWAGFAIAVLGILCVLSFVAFLILSDDVATFLIDRVGAVSVIVGSLVGSALLLFLLSRMDR